MCGGLAAIYAVVSACVGDFSRFHRYVSPALPDGTRMTFVFPRGLIPKMESGSHALARPPARQFLSEFWSVLHGHPASGAEECWASVNRFEPELPTGRNTVDSFDEHTGRSQVVRFGAYVNDPVTRRLFAFCYVRADAASDEDQELSRQIQSSFVILRKGEPIPADYPLVYGDYLDEHPKH
jgi:hypothetical protein